MIYILKIITNSKNELQIGIYHKCNLFCIEQILFFKQHIAVL